LKNILPFLKLIRWPNLLIMAIILVVLRYGFLLALGFEVVLSPLWHSVFIGITLLLAAGGNAVNDAHDINADRINKPSKMIIGKGITHDGALFIGQFLLLLGAILGLVLGYFNNMLIFSYIFALSALLLWFYATTLKRTAFLGNLLIAFLGGLMVFNEAIFDVLLTLKSEMRDVQIQAVWVIVAVSAFSFMLTLAREIIKDLQDIEGDRQAGYKTLPITSGTLFPKILGILILMLVAVSIGILAYKTILAHDWLSSSYLIIFLLLPLLYIIVNVAPANTPVKLGRISTLIKLVMVAGIFAVLVFTLSFRLAF
jgi:4-hydroxybenzoate polyprenyltransferase